MGPDCTHPDWIHSPMVFLQYLIPAAGTVVANSVFTFELNDWQEASDLRSRLTSITGQLSLDSFEAGYFGKLFGPLDLRNCINDPNIYYNSRFLSSLESNLSCCLVSVIRSYFFGSPCFHRHLVYHFSLVTSGTGVYHSSYLTCIAARPWWSCQAQHPTCISQDFSAAPSLRRKHGSAIHQFVLALTASDFYFDSDCDYDCGYDYWSNYCHCVHSSSISWSVLAT